MKSLAKDITETIHREGLNKKDRRRHIVHQRMYLMNILRNHEVKLKAIGLMFNLHHATVIHLITKYKDLKNMNDALLNVDTLHLQEIFEGKYSEPVFSIVYDVNNAVTRYDWNTIRARVERGVYTDIVKQS
jgi:hypothetical protein